MKICLIKDCNKIHKAKGFCNKHYTLFRKTGNPVSLRRRTIIKVNSDVLIKSTYKSYYNMIDRCSNKKNKRFKDYGGRGINICKDWIVSFDNFIKDMGKKPSFKHSIDRINNDLGYCKENCKWSTDLEQVYNRRIQHNNTSGVVGVSYDKRWKGRWIARVNDGKGNRRSLGSFTTKEEAKIHIVNYKKEMNFIL